MPVRDPVLEKKLSRFRDFWDRKPVKRPIIGIDIGGWFPFQRFSSLSRITDGAQIAPEQLSSGECLSDYEKFFQRSLATEDDLVKGAAPISAIPWMEGVLGARLRRNRDSVWADERRLSWDDIFSFDLTDDNPWLCRYLSFVKDLSEQGRGRYPVGLPILRGVADLFGMLRGHSEALIDCIEEPELSRKACAVCADALTGLVRQHHGTAGDFYGGYYIEQYGIWAPEPFVRLQEDESAVYSPDLYVRIIQDFDRKIAASFPYSLIHLHSASLFLLEHFLDVKEIDVFEINKDICEMDLPQMMPYLKRIQEAGRLLYVRGPLTRDDYRLISRELSPEGLVLQTVVQNLEEAREVHEALNGIYPG
ncbi:hypothetical protein [Marispirochaeta aestuarii]|uniref:hypothetical protein n=1 Tax=Marispirochaeta aestuarii TaxID=1963862 RepID=UPI0029C6BD36|nr:hypothetical protein [Marispirochaeta aestuarii]